MSRAENFRELKPDECSLKNEQDVNFTKTLEELNTDGQNQKVSTIIFDNTNINHEIESSRLLIRQSRSRYDVDEPNNHAVGENERIELLPSSSFLEKLDQAYEKLLPSEKTFCLRKV